MNRYLNFAWHSHFTFADARRIGKVLNVMENLAEKDNFFADALEQFETAVVIKKIDMCKYLLEIFNSVKDSNVMSLEQAVILSAYE